MFQVLAKWGEYSNDVQFILQRSPLDSGSKSPGSPAPKEVKQGFPPSGQSMKKSSTFTGPLPSHHQPAIWKSPPGVVSHKPIVSSVSSGRLSDLSRSLAPDTGARLSPDSGRGSDPTGSDTSNFSDQEKARVSGGVARTSQVSGYTPPGWQVRSARFTSPSPDRGDHLYGYSRSHPALPPAYRPPPQPSSLRNSSPADPPPYRDPPPAPGTISPASPSVSRHGQQPPVRAPHYSPPPHHRDLRGHKGPSPGRSTSHSVRGVSASPSRGQNSPARQLTSSWGPALRSGDNMVWPGQHRYQHQVILDNE